MKEQNEISTLPVLQKVTDVGIPTKKLNTVQQKTYREYADKVYDGVATMLSQIRQRVLGKIQVDNTDKIRKEIIKETPEIKEIIKELNAIVKASEVVTNESYKIMSEYENKKMKLDADKESKIAALKNEKMLPLVEQFKILQEKSRSFRKNNNYKNALQDTALRISTERKYYEDDEDDTDEFSVLAKKRSLEIAYPSLSTNNLRLTEDNFVNHVVVEERLQEVMTPARQEFDIAEIKLESMGQAVKEVMMFDEDRMNEAFTKLFAFRDDIQQKHLQIVRGINYNLNEVNNGD